MFKNSKTKTCQILEGKVLNQIIQKYLSFDHQNHHEVYQLYAEMQKIPNLKTQIASLDLDNALGTAIDNKNDYISSFLDPSDLEDWLLLDYNHKKDEHFSFYLSEILNYFYI